VNPSIAWSIDSECLVCTEIALDCCSAWDEDDLRHGYRQSIRDALVWLASSGFPVTGSFFFAEAQVRAGSAGSPAGGFGVSKDLNSVLPKANDFIAAVSLACAA
jgi:hypothetical protein